MGLDNMISVKIKDKTKFTENELLHLGTYHKYDDSYELMYWRKCWNIRELIMYKMHTAGLRTVNDCSEDMPMPVDFLKSLIYTLNQCYTPEWWQEHDDSIWSFDDICENMHGELIEAMVAVYILEQKDPDSYEIDFLDSY